MIKVINSSPAWLREEQLDTNIILYNHLKLQYVSSKEVKLMFGFTDLTEFESHN